MRCRVSSSEVRRCGPRRSDSLSRRSLVRRATLVLLALSLLGGKKAKARKTALEDPWSPESIEQALDTLIPLVEQHASASFDGRPIVKLAEDVPFEERMVAQMEWTFAQITPDASEELRRQLAVDASRGLLYGVFGVYNYTEGEVYLARDTMRAARQGAGMSPEQERDLMTVVLAHEIAHTLEDHVIDLKHTIQQAEDLEHFSAAGCTWEGWATWIAGAVSKDLGIEDVFWKANALQGWDRHGIQDPGSFSVAFRYGQGYRFMEHHVAAGGTEQAWQTLRQPPAHTGMIYRPALYDPAIPEAPVELMAALEGVDAALDKAEWARMDSRIGESTLRAAAAFETTGMEDVDAMLGRLVWGHHVSLAQPNKQANVLLMQFEEDQDAKDWMETLVRQETAKARHDAAKRGQAVEREVIPLPDLPADEALERRITPPGARIPLTQGVARKGAVLVVVETQRYLPGLRLERALASVLEKLPAP